MSWIIRKLLDLDLVKDLTQFNSINKQMNLNTKLDPINKCAKFENLNTWFIFSSWVTRLKNN